MSNDKTIWQNEYIKIVIEESEIPWLKIFTIDPYREMSQVPHDTRVMIYEILNTIEKEMISYFKPDKINIASFGNYLPHVHWHIMSRFKYDSYFPEPMWGKKQRESDLDIPPLEPFIKSLAVRLQEMNF